MLYLSFSVWYDPYSWGGDVQFFVEEEIVHMRNMHIDEYDVMNTKKVCPHKLHTTSSFTIDSLHTSSSS